MNMMNWHISPFSFKSNIKCECGSSIELVMRSQIFAKVVNSSDRLMDSVSS